MLLQAAKHDESSRPIGLHYTCFKSQTLTLARYRGLISKRPEQTKSPCSNKEANEPDFFGNVKHFEVQAKGLRCSLPLSKTTKGKCHLPTDPACSLHSCCTTAANSPGQSRS